MSEVLRLYPTPNKIKKSRRFWQGSTQQARKAAGRGHGSLFLRLLAATHLLPLEVLVQQVQGFLVGTGTSHDGEHPLAALIVRCFGDGDAGAGALADLADFGPTSADDTANHIGRNADVLSLHFFAIFSDHGDPATANSSVGSVSVDVAVLAEVGSAPSAVVRSASTAVVAADSWATNASAVDGSSSGLRSNRGVVENCASPTLPVIDEALANLPDSFLDSFRGALDLDDSLSGLGKHLLLGNHANTGDILDVLDLEAGASDDGAHLVVRDEEADSFGC